jgi:hypothetical protein
MKKLFLAVFALIMLNTSFAQTHPAKKSAKSDSATVATKPANGVVLKKDGTPDKRYKQSTGPLKKDGTPDKRYKANKTK